MAILIPERRRVVVSGKVQGVAFLLWVKNVASSLELAGSVQALPDGRCEAVVQGDKTLVKQFVIACKRGPAEATVEGIEQEVVPVDPKLATFIVYRQRGRQRRQTSVKEESGPIVDSPHELVG